MVPTTPLALAQLALQQAIAARNALRAANPHVINGLIAAEAALELAEEQRDDDNIDEHLRETSEFEAFHAYAEARKAYTDLFSNVVMDVREAEAAVEAAR